ncbi:hypothetical protein P7C73_g6553, partial [Tremellales sp. Uapishka_1]
MVSPALPGLFFAFAGMTLLLFASVSPPAWDAVNFVSANSPSGTTVYGMLGYCIKGGGCTSRNVGYDLALPGATNVVLNSQVLHNLTYTLIIHPIAGFFAFLSVLFGLLGIAAASRVCTIFMALTGAIAAFLALVIFVIDMVLWNIVKNRIVDAGYHATLVRLPLSSRSEFALTSPQGNANWLTVGAVVALFLSFCTSVCGACGRFASGRMAGEKY